MEMSKMILAIEAFSILLPLALILVLSKLLSILAKKIGLPQVIGLLNDRLRSELSVILI